MHSLCMYVCVPMCLSLGGGDQHVTGPSLGTRVATFPPRKNLFAWVQQIECVRMTQPASLLVAYQWQKSPQCYKPDCKHTGKRTPIKSIDAGVFYRCNKCGWLFR